ncbi:hypothetical protein ACNAN0_09310 [Agrilactobacillus fermenti]|uniref:hypothetical protein n=1 Tax=Agrilactobacillus fermenti TaxID=2586909 RepID=UPI001E37BA01|nr:hypothetical protein [Agrilactobacillus fermenti]MCD2255387.1 DUF3784 domain-containing protein [Agrilactobacillus fermenti]
MGELILIGIALLFLVIGFKIYHGKWLHLLAGNTFGDADEYLRTNKKYRWFGIGMLIVGLAALIISVILFIIFGFR